MSLVFKWTHEVFKLCLQRTFPNTYFGGFNNRRASLIRRAVSEYFGICGPSISKPFFGQEAFRNESNDPWLRPELI